MDQAVQIVVSEIESLERRVRAFSEFASEPPVHPEVARHQRARHRARRAAAPGASRERRIISGSTPRRPRVHAAPDLVKGILTNLLQNAAEAAGAGRRGPRRRRAATASDVLDRSARFGPGLSEEASATLFEPTITFKKHGMGLGLSIAKKNALLSGGDITLVAGELGGAGVQGDAAAAHRLGRAS